MKTIVLNTRGEEFQHERYSFRGVALHTETLEKIDVWVSDCDSKNEISDLPSGKYRHFKGGDYLFVGVSHYRMTGEYLVVYKPLYNSRDYPGGTLWCRPLGDFLGKKKVGNVEVPRFEYIKE